MLAAGDAIVAFHFIFICIQTHYCTYRHKNINHPITIPLTQKTTFELFLKTKINTSNPFRHLVLILVSGWM
jgi:hypothetical protein